MSITLPQPRFIDPNAIASREELQERLAKDPNDPLVLAFRMELRELTHAHGISSEEAMEALFKQRQAAKRRPKRSAVAWSRHGSVRSGFRFLLVLVNLHFAVIAYASRPEDRFTVIKGALAASLVLLAAFFIGTRAEPKADGSVVSAVAGFGFAVGLAAITLLGVVLVGVVWVGTPDTTYAGVLRMMFHFR